MTEDSTPDDEAVRRLLRALPEVAPPEGFFDDLIRTRRRRARVVAGIGLTAAGVAGAIVVAQATGIAGEVAPEMGDLAVRHQTMVTVGDSSPVTGQMPGDEVPAPYPAPEELGRLARGLAVWHPDDVVQIIYADDGHYVSVFEQAGDMSDDAMPADLTPIDLEGTDAWRADDGTVVVRRDGVVYVVVGDIEPEMLAEVVEDLPDARPMGLSRRIGDAMDDLVTAFGLG